MLLKPPCPNCGQLMTDRYLGAEGEHECRTCQIALAPLSEMCTKEGTKLLLTFTDRPYIENMPHREELVQWLLKHSIYEPAV